MTNFSCLWFLILAVFVCISCTNQNEEPRAESCKRFFISTDTVINKTRENALNITYSKDTFFCNQPINYNQAILLLKSKFSGIDELNEHQTTKIFLKSLLLSEFVYATSSFQFFGSELGKTNHNIAIKGWNKLPLVSCYQIANYNIEPLWCGDRTTFYIRLLNELLGIKATDITIQDVHTFPIVDIGNKRFILDPYDPFIVFDSSCSRIIDYNELLNFDVKNNSFKVLRTKRTFGFATELISNNLAHAVLSNASNNGNDFPKSLLNYLNVNSANLLKNVTPCDFEFFNKTGVVYPSNLKQDKYIIRLVDNLNNAPMNLNHFRKYYLGINCK